MVGGRAAVLMQSCGIFLFRQYPNVNCTSLNSQRHILSNDLESVNVAKSFPIYFKHKKLFYLFLLQTRS